VVLIPLLYHLAGSVAVVFSLCAFLWEVLRNGLKGLYALIYPVVFLLTAFVCVKASMTAGWEHALTPFMYYDWPSTYFFPLYAWASVPVLMLAARFLAKDSSRLSAYGPAIGLAAALALAGYFYNAVHSRSYYRLIQEQQLAAEGEWDEIIRTADRRQPDYLISYLNLALAHKGQLVEKLGYYNPQPVSKVMFPTPNLKTGLSLQSAVYLSWGYVAAARQAAFDANMVTPGMHNPQQLKVLVLTNMALGAPEVAEKYVNILDKTLFYRGWAQQMRRALNDSACEPDELRRLREALPQKGEYVRYDGLKGDMKDILEADPSNEILSQFYTAYQMLETLEERR
jgi:ribosomal protein S16